MSTAGDREALHRLIDELRLEDVGTAQRVLQALNANSDPLLAALNNAPPDDEAETDAEREAIERARQDLRQGNTFIYADSLPA
jgi:hypothetical protein